MFPSVLMSSKFIECIFLERATISGEVQILHLAPRIRCIDRWTWHSSEIIMFTASRWTNIFSREVKCSLLEALIFAVVFVIAFIGFGKLLLRSRLGPHHLWYERPKLVDFCSFSLELLKFFCLALWFCQRKIDRHIVFQIVYMWKEYKRRMQRMANVKRLCKENQFWP